MSFGCFTRRAMWASRVITAVLVGCVIAIGGCESSRSAASESRGPTIVVNPYANVDWDTFEHHRAALHTHTLQSDGRHSVKDVVMAYRGAGFTILAITDHDTREPNVHVERGNVPKEEASPYPLDPKPETFPANTTWPWTAYGTPAPEALGMVGIEGNELSSRHHINSLYNGFGIAHRNMEEDDQLFAVRDRGGLAFINHPGIDAKWWTRRPVEWYVERFEKHGREYLVGIEITNCTTATEKYDEGLWDQLLARFMPERPIWGFGNDDMHLLSGAHETDCVFVLAELSEGAVRAAMEAGQFYFRKASRHNDVRQRDPAVNPFPVIKAIHVDESAGTITVQAANYDVIQWISAPESLEPVADYKTSNAPWLLGRLVHEGETLDCRNTANLNRYVRVELQRTDGEVVFRVFTNPFGLALTK